MEFIIRLHLLIIQVKVISDLQKKFAAQQNNLITMETVAKEQLHLLANQSEAAIDGAHHKLLEANNKLKEFHKFVQVNKNHFLLLESKLKHCCLL